jgi:hypothetical protein
LKCCHLIRQVLCCFKDTAKRLIFPILPQTLAT